MNRRLSVIRAFLLGIPSLAVLVVAFSWFVLGRERAVTAARVYVGPAPEPQGMGERRVAFRAQVLRSFSGVETGRQTSVQALVTAFGRTESAEFMSDANGVVSVNMVFEDRQVAGAPIDVDIVLLQGESILAEGRWVAGALPEGRQGGARFAEDTLPSGINVVLSLLHGVLAVPFANAIELQLTREGKPLSGFPVELSLEGAALRGPEKLTTDARGQVRSGMRTETHHVSVRVRVTDEIGTIDTALFALPVVPGAMLATLNGAVLEVQSAVPRDVAYVNIVDERQTLWVGSVPLLPSEVGASGSVKLPPLPGPLWALTSSEFDLQAMALVGWPIGEPSGRSSLERRDRLALDGFVDARAAETERQRRTRSAGVSAALLATLLEIALLLAYLRFQRRSRSHLPAELSSVVGGAPGPTIVAILLLLIGFASLAWLVVARP